VPLAVPPAQALPALSIPAGTTLAQLSHRDVAAAGIAPSAPTALPHPGQGTVGALVNTVMNFRIP
jgi:hypothetical protein